MTAKPLFDIPFLASRWEEDYRQFLADGTADLLLERMRNWARGGRLKETSSEASFIKQFFCLSWDYAQEGDTPDGEFQCHPQFPVEMAGQTGGTGFADLALGFFRKDAPSPPVPQVLCEFKDIHSALDKRQNRKGNDRSPVEQCLDYLRNARTRLTGRETVEPFWAIVTDMDEFRLYCAKFGQAQFQRFVIHPAEADETESLLADSESAAFQRFVFWKLFGKSSLLADRGASRLQKLLDDQLIHEQLLEKDFYLEYRAYREFLYRTIRDANPGFPGTPGQMIRLTQRFLDRCIFLLFCEDMGRSLDFPGDLLRDVLIHYSQDAYYNPGDILPWERLKTIFATMRDGGDFGDHKINRFNGGLFETLPELDGLRIPAKVFCAKGQGSGGDATLLSHPLTLLFFSAKYNFGIKDAGHQRVIDFYALGRIFEQSITELEIMEAEAEGRPSINLLSKRKRDGVYYTPEWVTEYIVRESLGARLADIKTELGLAPQKAPTDADIEKYRRFLKDGRYTAPVAAAWVKDLKQYEFRLKQIAVVDPACGSGAFLIQALEYLKSEHRWVFGELERVRGYTELWETDTVIKDILNNNLYGVDINPESVEITKLALWMHTALPGKTLSQLDRNILCGNSLVGPDFADFYRQKHETLFDDLDESKRERINAFDWRAAFPAVFSRGGFDCVIGNPPYVKLQNFRKVEEDVAEYLVQAKRADGSPVYASTQVGNFDLYLPFIEKGVDLLAPDGRMGYIAPNVWMVNEYGRPLRRKLKQNRTLDRWVDFKSFQVFDEATTYTALQFFRGQPGDALRCFFAPDGDISAIDWNHAHAAISFDDLPENDAWNLLPDAERRLIGKLRMNCKPLGDNKWTRQIFQGLITSADNIYHLHRMALNRFQTHSEEEIAIEREFMHPLISGQETKRYQIPKTKTWILFPYDVSGSKPRLFSKEEMLKSFPKAWAYLQSHEDRLREREKRKFDDAKWYRFGRNQNIDKQELPKLCVAQTVPGMRVFYDVEGRFYINNVRVNAILSTSKTNDWYLLGILNAPVADYVFRRTAKPKDGGYYEANKQFIAPLPIPDATDEQKRAVGDRAMALQEMHTLRRDLMGKLVRRLESSRMTDVKHRHSWLWADAKSAAEMKKRADAPAGMKGRELTRWAKGQADAALQMHLDELDACLRPEIELSAENTGDELRFLIGGATVVELFDQPDTPLIAAQWRQFARSTHVTAKFAAKKLVSALLSLRETDDAALKQAVVGLDAEIRDLDGKIDRAEHELNHIIYGLYDLNPDEIRLIEA